MDKKFSISIEIYLVLLFSIISLIVIKIFDLDFYFADKIYASNHAWVLKDDWFISKVMHNYAKDLIIFLFLLFLIWLIVLMTNKNKNKKALVRPLLVLLLGLILGTLSVSILKHLISSDCPWDLIRYGGTKPFFHIFNYDPSYLPSSGCFPAAHASVGFTLIAFYFYCSIHDKKHRFHALTAALLIGFTFGYTQQLRGAHFISHTFYSLIVCIAVNIAIYSFIYNFKFSKLQILFNKKLDF